MNNKPLILELDELKKTLFDIVNASVNEKHIPCYFIKPIVDELLKQVSSFADNEVSVLKENQNRNNKNEENEKSNETEA